MCIYTADNANVDGHAAEEITRLTAELQALKAEIARLTAELRAAS